MKLSTKINKVKNSCIATDFYVDILEKWKSFQQKLEFPALEEEYGFKFNSLKPCRITDNGELCIDNILSLKIKSNFLQKGINLEISMYLWS